MKKQITNDFEPSISVEAMYIVGVPVQIDSLLTGLSKSLFSSIRSVPHGESVDYRDFRFETGGFWHTLTLLYWSPMHEDLWGYSEETQSWRFLAEYNPSLDFPLVTAPDLLETPEFSDLDFAYRVSHYNRLYNQGLYRPPHHDEAVEYAGDYLSELLCNRGIVRSGSVIPGLYGGYFTRDGRIVGRYF